MMKSKVIAWAVYVLLIAAVFGVPIWLNAADWSNPNPQSVADKAGPLLLKHELNMTDLYSGSTSKLNLLKSNHASGTSPSLPSTGQAWYDITNHYFKIYDATWGGGGILSSGTSSFSNIVSIGTVTFTGTVVGSGTNLCIPYEIDGHTDASPEAAKFLCGATIYNYGQAAANVNITLPEAAANMSFIAMVGTAQASNYWRFTAASAGTMYVNGAASKNYAQFSAPAAGNYFGCITFKTGSSTYGWICKPGNGTLTTN
jgi:hypothetical protein